MTAARRCRVVEGSCWHCRKKRLKCDLSRPSCSRCQDEEHACSYSTTAPIQWVGGPAKRGRLASPKSPSPACTVVATSPTMQPLEPGELISYFTNTVLPRFQIPDTPIDLNFENLPRDEPLQQAIIAVSQAHYAIHSKVELYDTVMIGKRARQTAIEGFRLCLAEGVQSDSSAQRLFAINILLCILDGMIKPSEDLNASTCHLRGGFAILDQWSNTPTRMLLQDGLQAHLLSVYATMDLVHALLSGDKPFFDSMIWKMFANVQTWFGRLPAGDHFLSILVAFSDMATLGNIVHRNFPIESVDLIERCLPPIEAIFTPNAADEDSKNDTINDSQWEAFCSIYEICGLIYLRRALRLRPLHDEIVQQATRKGVERLMDEDLPGMMRHCVIFPILVIGSHCVLSQDRKAVLEALSPSTSYLSFGNLQLMTDFLKATWAGDISQQSWWDCFAAVSQKAFLF